MPTNETEATVHALERGYCQVCGANIALRKGGLAREHTHKGEKCAGSGKPSVASKLDAGLAAAAVETVDEAAAADAAYRDAVDAGATPAEAAAAAADGAAQSRAKKGAKKAGALTGKRLAEAEAAEAKKTAKPKAKPGIAKNGDVPAAGSAPVLMQLPLDLVDANPGNVRVNLGTDQELDELADSIKSLGVVEPIVAHRRANGRVEVIAGDRRLEAARRAGVADVPVIIRPGVSDKERAELNLLENLHRKDLEPLEEAEAYRRLTKDHGYSQSELARRLGRAQSHISKRLALLALPAPIRDRVGVDLGVNEALALSKVPATVAKKALDDVAEFAKTPEQIARALPAALRRAETEQAEQKAHAARLAELKATGVRVIDYPRWAYQLPAGTADLDDLPSLAATIDDTLTGDDLLAALAASHVACPGHAAGVDPAGAVHYVCTAVAEQHPADNVDDDTDEEASDAEREKLREDWEAANVRRRQAMVAVLNGRVPVATRFGLVSLALLDLLDLDDGQTDWYEAAGIVADLLGADPVATAEDNWVGYIAAMVEAHGAPTAGLAAALAAGDSPLTRFRFPAFDGDEGDPYAGYRPVTIRHLTLLQDHGGYTLAPWEQARLELGDTAAAYEARAACRICDARHPGGVDPRQFAVLGDGEADAIRQTVCDKQTRRVDDGDDWETPPAAGDVDAVAVAKAKAEADPTD